MVLNEYLPINEQGKLTSQTEKKAKNKFCNNYTTWFINFKLNLKL